MRLNALHVERQSRAGKLIIQARRLSSSISDSLSFSFDYLLGIIG